MTEVEPVQPGSYELPVQASDTVQPGAAIGTLRDSFPEPLLVKNIRWFCTLRWIVVSLFVAYGTASFIPSVFPYLSLVPATGWPFVVAGILALANLAFLNHAKLLSGSAAPHRIKINLWSQIVTDLLVVTVVVHFVGSLETYVPFLYLFHIVLACIFFSRRESFAVTLISSTLYVACVTFESTGILAPASIYANTAVRQRLELSPALPVLNTVSAITIWLVVWYLASHLSALLRAMDAQLAETNRRLEEAQGERTKHMLRTTHELKAPFAAIQANTQLLLKGYCGVLSDDVLTIVRRIADRCQRLANEIQEMLQLANLQAAKIESLDWIELDLAEIVRWSISQVQQTADERRIIIEQDVRSVQVIGVEDHLKMLFSNLLANAVLYSYEGGRVRVWCLDGHGPIATVEDHGIGIAPDKLPHIFDEYYRTDEAVRHNKASTGLGLTIVRQVAQTHRIRVRVESSPGVGTKFIVRFPSPSKAVEVGT